jgi:two-component system OmpR family sensor kinase/two-component system sensor histidine kinase BaeS
MTHAPDLHRSVRQIRRRLFLLLMQAFGAVVLLTVVILLAIVVFFIGRTLTGNASFRPPQLSQSNTAQAYYLGHGSWDGVEALVADSQTDPSFLGRGWGDILLLDERGQVLIDQGRTDTAQIGQPYSLTKGDVQFPLRVNETQIGMLVLQGSVLNWPRSLIRDLIFPVGAISFFTGLLTLLIGYLLVRRVVTPLADVIAAAHAVADGDLSTRVQVRGPGDLRGLSDSFNRMAGALERNDRERRDLLADIAHELRTPLTVIRGKLEGIVDGVYPADESHVAPVLEETYVLEKLVEDLRLLTLAETRQLHFDREAVDLNDLAGRAADLFSAEAADKSITIGLGAEPGLPAVTADPQRVAQVIGNLLSNALRYVPEGGRITINTRRLPEGVELAISDDGPGVPEADLPRLFDRFWRGEKSRSRSAGGAGLGLAIARQLIEAQGGRITASNDPEGGLRVAFVLK